MKAYLGIDVGSVSTNLALVDEYNNVVDYVYLRTCGQPIKMLQQGLRDLFVRKPKDLQVEGVGTTGSGRHLAGIIAGADIVKNEITTHAVAASCVVPGTRTILEIGGQDSKIVVLRGGIVSDFAMNTVCAAGTGSFLDQQASRLNISIEDFGPMALESHNPVRIAGRCAVFAESDMIHKQQLGYNLPDILAGLCEALVRNYLNNVGKGKDIQPPVVFQGGVAANVGMKRAFENALGVEVTVPPHYHIMGSLGAAILAREQVKRTGFSNFKGFSTSEDNFRASGFECNGCANCCEIVEILKSNTVIARWGDRCGKWSTAADTGAGQKERIS